MADGDRRVRIAIPETAAPGTVITVKALISHPMETGYRRDAMGRAIPRHILTRFRCRYDDQSIIDIELNPGVAANPFLSFRFRALHSGTVYFEWTDQDGTVTREQRTLTVG